MTNLHEWALAMFCGIIVTLAIFGVALFIQIGHEYLEKRRKKKTGNGYSKRTKMKSGSCHYCGEEVSFNRGENYILISRPSDPRTTDGNAYRSLFFHTSCFVEVAGKDFVPSLRCSQREFFRDTEGGLAFGHTAIASPEKPVWPWLL